MLPPTLPELLRDDSRPYFLWWTDLTVGEFRRRLVEGSLATIGYWLGALLREANTRDVWLFTSPSEIRARWMEVSPHLGRSREMWAWLLSLDSTREASRVD